MDFETSNNEFVAEIRAWLRTNLETPPEFANLDEEVVWGRAWQAKLDGSNLVGLHWPPEYGGRGATAVEVALFNMEYARFGAPQLINRVGINLAGPTLLAHGTDAQKERWLRRILSAEDIWCQLFSEPDAGSDLAAVATRAVKADGGFLLTGQKVWTSYAMQADYGICLARTDAAAPKHRGISYFVVPMVAAGIEIRPLVQITSDAEFNEVFLEDVFVPDDHLIGPLNGGWAVANTTLAHERGTSFPFKEQVLHETYLADLFAAALTNGTIDDVDVADGLVQSFVELRILRLHNQRTMSNLARGREPGPESSYVKLCWSDMTQHLSEVAMLIMGAAAPLHGRWQRQWLWSRAATIAGGTSEIQRTIIGERICGLPR